LAVSTTPSTAKAQRCLYCQQTYPLYPPLVSGCTVCATEKFKSPLELVFEHPGSLDFLRTPPLPGLERYAPLLPPLVKGLSLAEGGTPLIPHSLREDNRQVEFFIKDESRNPTWSHKDRLNLAVVSTAVIVEAVGVVAASSGNHGASAAAYSARANLPGVILSTPRPAAVASFMQAYGQLVVAVPTFEIRWELMRRLVEEFNYHPASNQTIPPTNHPFGSEGYKTIAYELFNQLEGRAPEAVFVPVGFAELLFGIYKGFSELKDFGLIERMPRMIACEPAAGAPVKRALELDEPIAYVEVGDTEAYSIAVPVNSYRAVVAVKGSNGAALAVTEQEMVSAQRAMSRAGMWAESSAAIAFAGAQRYTELGIEKGPLVCINTSSGFKDQGVGRNPIVEIDGEWTSLLEEMRRSGLLKK
jgi:threonine synthase